MHAFQKDKGCNFVSFGNQSLYFDNIDILSHFNVSKGTILLQRVKFPWIIKIKIVGVELIELPAYLIRWLHAGRKLGQETLLSTPED